MSAWTVVPCLLALRDEFNKINPKRDKGADGTIGDTNHTSASDHTPDEDSDVLRDHDADSKNEVHALDIDSTGPWGGRSFDDIILALVARERAEYNHPTIKARLKYVIWNRRIALRSNGWAWRAYTREDPHTNHAHFSALYTTSTENDTRSWGVAPAETPKDDDVTEAQLIEAVTKALRGWTEPDPSPNANPPGVHARVGGWLRWAETRAAYRQDAVLARVAGIEATLAQFGAVLAELAGRPASGAPTLEELSLALREVLREGVSE